MPTPPPAPQRTDLSRDLDHNGVVDGADDRTRDLNHDGVINSVDRQEQDLNHDHAIDSTDRQLQTDTTRTQNRVGTSLGWTKTDEAWKRPETSTAQQQSLGPKVGGV